MDKVLLYFSLKYFGNWDEIYNALDTKEKISHVDLEKVESKIDCNYITILSPLYPNYLKNCHKPPFVIYFKGDNELLVKYHKAIGIVGGKEYDEYGLFMAEKLSKELSEENRILVTYQKEGINEKVIDYCKENLVENIIVLQDDMKSTLMKLQETKVNDKTLYITESYEKNTKYQENYDTYTNRMLCGLVKGVIFCPYSQEDNFKDLINFAINEGKELFAVPCTSKVLNQTNKLIKMGAKLTENAKDVLNEI
ncbi:DNA processing protein [Spiroplasma chinense]|uniref:DNA processing protein n=1 Tax=Spiroplasma chinense TaxID=216932 RepID=A0A5B9Y3L4_9MOLU|nr:DNA-processing protein DprA [Spiroplasma chinense]QEH61654.1 DNA processing protein [Spiroplasma chinense]